MDTLDGLRLAVRKLGDPLRFFLLMTFIIIAMTFACGL